MAQYEVRSTNAHSALHDLAAFCAGAQLEIERMLADKDSSDNDYISCLVEVREYCRHALRKLREGNDEASREALITFADRLEDAMVQMHKIRKC